MNAFLTALCLLYWLVCLPEAPAAKVLLAAASFLFLVWRFSLFQKRMLAASILLIPAVTWQPAVKEEPPAGVYEIVQVKKNYAVGQMEGHRILMYSDEDIFWQDRYEVKSFREVHSRNNEG
ncbi:MAG: hypothetical protein HUJ54_02275, partial [Erysipelotrichaceae bacterium]|nr:hypothetical protein [Erysipelotrichaceae bacterium]